MTNVQALIGNIQKNSFLPLFRFKQWNENEYLLTSEVGTFIFLETQDFFNYIQGNITKEHEQYDELYKKFFIKDETYIRRISERFREKNSFMKKPTSLHILVLTLKCNHKCLYCHASVGMESDTSLDMSNETAKKSIDLIFSSPGKYISIEFQGGESTANWETLEFSVKYIEEKKQQHPEKEIKTALVSNLTLLTDERLQFLLDSEVHIATSLDGPEFLHNESRIYHDANSYQEVTKWLKKVQNEIFRRRKENPNYKTPLPGALITITKPMLSHAKEIVECYRENGMNNIFLRALHPIGFAKKTWNKIGYTAEEFIQFYEEALDYILELNKNGTKFRENLASIKLKKIIGKHDSGYFEDISPCGGGIGQIAYNYDGNIYTCDEGRMIGREGDEAFKMGNVHAHTWNDLIRSKTTKSICTVSCNEGYAGLANHVYKPYIGICPASNYSSTGQMHPNFYESEYFRRHELLIDLLMKKMRDPENEKIFQTWAH